MMSQKAMKLALEALEVATTPLARDRQEVLRAITALREALAEQPAQQEPVAWGIIASNTGRICQVELDADEIEGHNPKYIVPLYTSPPASKPLTNEQIGQAARDAHIAFCLNKHQTYEHAIARAIEAAHGIKENT